jgi:hypothetical protein
MGRIKQRHRSRDTNSRRLYPWEKLSPREEGVLAAVRKQHSAALGKLEADGIDTKMLAFWFTQWAWGAKAQSEAALPYREDWKAIERAVGGLERAIRSCRPSGFREGMYDCLRRSGLRVLLAIYWQPNGGKRHKREDQPRGDAAVGLLSWVRRQSKRGQCHFGTIAGMLHAVSDEYKHQGNGTIYTPSKVSLRRLWKRRTVHR